MEAQLMNKSVSVDKIVKRNFLKAFTENKFYYVRNLKILVSDCHGK